MTSTLDFLRALYGNADEGHLTLFTIDRNGERRTHWYDVTNYEQMAAEGQAMHDRNVWFGVSTRTEQLDEGRRGGAAECLALPALFVDIDIAGPNHKDSTHLPADQTQAVDLIDKFPLRPSTIVNSGGGLHAYWLTDEMIGHDDAIVLLARWAETWQQIATKMRLRVDNVFDLPRVLRLPGTGNLKNDAPVTILEHREIRYGYSEFVDATVEPPQRQHRSTIAGMPVVGTRPGDVFNQRHPAGYVLALDGWRLARTDRSGNEAWLHPWGPSSDCSATVYADDGHCTIWSDTVPQHRPVETKTPYDAFGLYVRLIHDGDFAEASRQLVLDGYGERVDVTIVTMPNGKCRPKRRLQVGARHLDDLANEVVDGLVELNDPPRLFVHGDIVSRLERGELTPVDRVALLHVVESSLQPVKRTKSGDEVPTRVDASALDLVLYRLTHDLPHIEGVARSPFMRADGTICSTEGWDETSNIYLAGGLTVDVPDQPTGEQVAAAVALIDELICDFPLAGPADRAHVFALLLTLVSRHLVPLVPLIALDGTGPGVGKNLLAESIAYIATGEWVQTDPLPLDAEEQRKQITAMLSTGRTVALFDEAHIISGVSLARLITSTTWGDRLLGYSKQVSYPNRLTVVALGNNVEVHGDMPRRTVLIRLASNLAHPELRTGFRHDNLRHWVEQQRAGLLSAALTIMRNWAAVGKPRGSRRLGSFDAWADMIGGALEAVGVAGFLSNIDEMRDRGATDDFDMGEHVRELAGWFGTSPFSAADVAEALTYKNIEAWPPKVSMDQSKMVQQIGYAYRRASNRWYGDLMLSVVGRQHGGARRWVVTERLANLLVTGDDGDDGDDRLSYTREKSGTHIEAERDEKTSSPSSPSSPPEPNPQPSLSVTVNPAVQALLGDGQ